jgi:hypothetical protein
MDVQEGRKCQKVTGCREDKKGRVAERKGPLPRDRAVAGAVTGFRAGGLIAKKECTL